MSFSCGFALGLRSAGSMMKSSTLAIGRKGVRLNLEELAPGSIIVAMTGVLTVSKRVGMLKSAAVLESSISTSVSFRSSWGRTRASPRSSPCGSRNVRFRDSAEEAFCDSAWILAEVARRRGLDVPDMWSRSSLDEPAIQAPPPRVEPVIKAPPPRVEPVIKAPPPRLEPASKAPPARLEFVTGGAILRPDKASSERAFKIFADDAILNVFWKLGMRRVLDLMPKCAVPLSM
mmetsp:Transcript_35125/g.110569  ORF Transcript_35125/g.110569 Transcript_35125/m.110569 type:complete len:232 (-) Transcript_35125:1383-2078(-)